MSSQSIRDRIKRGDEVYIVVRPAPNLPPKRKPARVLDVVRSGVRVVDEGRERMVPFSEIELPTAVAIEAEKRATHPIVEYQRPPLAVVAAPPPSQSTNVASFDPRDLDAWLEMGRSLESDLAIAMAEETAAIRALDEERKEIEKEIEQRTLRFRDLETKHALVRRGSR